MAHTPFGAQPEHGPSNSLHAGHPQPPQSPEWDPQPPRSRSAMITRFVGTVLHFPFHVLVISAAIAIVLAFSLVMEFVCAVLWFLEKPAEKLMERFLAPFVMRPRWWVNWNELWHEGDLKFHRARLERRLAKKKPKVTTAKFPFHQYRAFGARGLLDIAAPQGWHLDEKVPPRPLVEVNLSRPEPGDRA